MVGLLVILVGLGGMEVNGPEIQTNSMHFESNLIVLWSSSRICRPGQRVEASWMRLGHDGLIGCTRN